MPARNWPTTGTPAPASPTDAPRGQRATARCPCRQNRVSCTIAAGDNSMGKRIAVFCDGTWSQLTAECPTNVVLGAQMVLPRADDGTQQLVLYKEGVGTSYLINKAWESRLAGAFGWGLFDNIADAYRFLVFNYRTGDEIFIFGFSRGAFTA